MKIKTAVIGLLLVAFLVGCGTTGTLSSNPPEDVNGNSIAVYRIGVGDDIQVSVWKNEELSVTVPVRPDGKISIPLVGDITAAGLTAVELSNTITNQLKTYIRSPQVTAIVLNAGSVDYLLRVRVTGAIESPISIPYKDGMTVLDLILEAGGPTEFASGNKARLYRRINGVMKIYPVRLNDILNKGSLDTNYTLAPSDIVTVPERVL